MVNAQEGATIHSEDYEIGFHEGYRTGLEWRSQIDDNHRNILKKYKQSQRALWLARARTAELQCEILEEAFPISMREEIVKWQAVERKCREKAEGM